MLEQWDDVVDVDGFNIDYIMSPAPFEDVVELPGPELKRGGLYDHLAEKGTLRERIYGVGQNGLRDDILEVDIVLTCMMETSMYLHQLM